jgi:micrococcal nuclease
MKRRSLKYLVALAIASLFVVFAKGRPVDYQDVRIAKVIDGDTAELANGQRVRYIGLDCPETHRKTDTGWVNVSEPFGEDAARFNEKSVLNKTARLEFDVQKTDKYKRLLAYCFVKEEGRELLVQAEILRNGLAYLYTFPPNVKYTDTLVKAAQEAKTARRGVWSQDLSVKCQQAGNFIGQRKMVEGKVVRTRSSQKVVQLKMEGVIIAIFAKDLDRFLKNGIDPSEFYKGKNIRVFGLIKEYRGEPEIIVSDPWQIEVLN